MTAIEVMDLVQSALWTVVLVAMPPLLLGLSVGLFVSLFQTITSIQEQTLTFVPKILAVFLGLMFFGPYMIQTVTDFTINLYSSFIYYIH